MPQSPGLVQAVGLPGRAAAPPALPLPVPCAGGQPAQGKGLLQQQDGICMQGESAWLNQESAQR